MTPDLLLARAAKAVLIAAAPDGFPQDCPIVATGDIEPQARPYLVCLVENGESPHPLMRKATLVLRLRTRPDEHPATTSDPWLAIARDFLTYHSASLHATLIPQGWKLKKFTPGPWSTEEEEDRGRIAEMRWTCILQELS